MLVKLTPGSQFYQQVMSSFSTLFLVITISITL
jgi:hypothetical protein